MIVLIILNCIILAAGGVLYLYWAVGGTWARPGATPTDEVGAELEKPRGRLLTRFLGLFLLTAAIVQLGRGGLLDIPISAGSWVIACWVLSGIFVLRALIGFLSTTVVDTGTSEEFDYWNLRLFSPLFLFLGITTVLINFI